MLFPYLLIKNFQGFWIGIKLEFKWPSWRACLMFLYAMCVFDLLILAMCVFKVIFLTVNSLMKKDSNILKDNMRGFELIAIVYKGLGAFIFGVTLQVGAKLDGNSTDPRVIVVLTLVAVAAGGLGVVHYSRKQKIELDGPALKLEEEEQGTEKSLYKSKDFRAYLLKLVG